MPDVYGNPTEAELRGQQFQATQGYSGSFTPNNPNISTRDIYGQNGELVSHDERATPDSDKSQNAPSFQGAFSDDPFYQRSDVRPVVSATNKDTRGKGHYGVRGWAHKHPLGVIGVMIAAAAGGASAMGWSPGGAGLDGASTGWGGEGTGGFNGASDFGPGMSVGGGNAGQLASSGGIGGGAGMGSATEAGAGGGMGSMMKGMKLPGQQQQQPKNTWFADELERQAKEKELKKQIADELGPKYV